MKTLLMLVALLICWTLPLSAEETLSAEEISLEGSDVIHYRYPDNFQESNRYIRKGIKMRNGDCKFHNTLPRLKPGERIFGKEIAYNPYTCESLVIEGLYTVEPQKKTDRTSEYTVATEHLAAAADSEWTVHAYLRTWYDDPIYWDVNSVTSEIWWDPTSDCALGNYFSSQPDYDWLALTGWNKLVGKDSPKSSCDSVSLNTTATYRSNAFPTCWVQNAPVLIRYIKNLVKGYADKSVEPNFKTVKAGPKFLCTNLLEENYEFYVEKRQLIVDGEIGCQGRPPALFFNDLKLNEGDIHTSASGNDYNGTPLFFDVDGLFQSNYIDFDIAIYTDSAHTQHVRTDHCFGDWDGSNFYDENCSLVQNTSAGCVPIWTRLIKDNNQNPGTQQLSPRHEYDDYSTETLMRR